MFDFDDGCSWTWISNSIRGLPVGIWNAATAGAGCFANGPAAHYRRIEHQSLVQFQRKESLESIIQPGEIDQERMAVQKFALGGFLIGFLAGVLFMQPRGLENPITVLE
ncbi:uncharacterized protein [Acropora muricata]|uniref:uncharacterized protein isoform X2 n=1 Tax=Acropora muricata TaxID=159855 RepID=UPI0034E5A3D4